MTDGATGSSMMLAPLVATLPRYDVDVASFLGQEGIEMRTLHNPMARIDSLRLVALWERVTEVTGDENFGLVAAQQYVPGWFHVLDYVVSSAPTLGDALERGVANLRLLHDLAYMALEVNGAEAVVALGSSRKLPLPRAQGDFFAACLVVVTRRLAGLDGSPTRVCFTHRKPVELGPARALFRCPLHYGASRIELAVPAQVLSYPCGGADPALAAIVLDHAASLLHQLPACDPLVHQVRTEVALAEQLSVDPATVARRLGMSARTLRRRLQDAGTSLKEVADDVRRIAAIHMLREQRLGPQQVADALGFATASAFARAFRRWTGESPSSFREATFSS